MIWASSIVTLRFTADNWQIPQVVEIRADSETKTDTGRLFTRSDLSQSVEFEYDDDAFEGHHSSVINHLVVSTAATVEGSPLDVKAVPTITLETDRPFYEFLGENITVTLADGVTLQHRRIINARLVDGDMQLTVDRSWLAGEQIPDSSSTFSIDLDDGELTGNPVAAANPTFTIADPLDPFSPFLDDVNDLLGRQVTIVNGIGTGQSRFITGADAVVAFTGSIGNISSPNVASFSLDMSEASDAVTVTSDGVLNILVNADLDLPTETLTVTIDGSTVDVLFADRSGRQYSAVRGSIPLTQAQLQSYANDGQIDISFTPSADVGNFGTSSLSFDLSFSVDANSTTFNKGVLGDLTLTLDRGWDEAAVPDTQSDFQIQIDDSLIGKATEIDESPSGLPADSSFPPRTRHADHVLERASHFR